MKHASIAFATLVAVGAGCTRTRTIQFRIHPMCADETACMSFSVGCATHVRVVYLDGDPGAGEPVTLGDTGCRAITPPERETLCQFGAEVGPLPAMPAGRPFKLQITTYAKSGSTSGDCSADDEVFSGESRIVRVSADLPPLVDVIVNKCRPALCTGVTGTVEDLITRYPISDPSVAVRFGYINGEQKFKSTTAMAANLDTAGRFSLVSDESNLPSSYGCRAFEVDWIGDHATLFCQPANAARPPIRNATVLTVTRDVAQSAERLMGMIVDRFADKGGYVLGRITRSTMAMAGAYLRRQPGRCPESVKAATGADCAWYPEEGWGGTRGDHLTGKNGIFLSAYRVDAYPDGQFEGRLMDDPGRLFIPYSSGFYAVNSIFIVSLNDDTGTGGPGPDASTDADASTD